MYFGFDVKYSETKSVVVILTSNTKVLNSKQLTSDKLILSKLTVYDV